MKTLMVACLLLAAMLAQAMPGALRGGGSGGGAPLEAWQEWGSGEMRWFGLALYDATLYVAGTDVERAPLALHLRYRRDISRERLVQASIAEMRRLGADSAQLKRWEAELNRVFPDVASGDSITGMRLPGKGVRFFHQDAACGDIADPDFGHWFFAIWLDPKSHSPALRSRLLQGPRTPP
jgi:hypothetical protein